jgi:hypothetical protein
MSTVDRLLAEYAAAFKSGKIDPWPYLDQVEGKEREELDRRMDEFLQGLEPAGWDPEAFAKSPAAALVERLVPEMLLPREGWRELLPSLRFRNKLKREQVDAELALALEARSEEESEKIADYYHDMEQGNLDSRGVSEEVLEALSEIYGTTVRVLRKVGGATGPSRTRGAVFARSENEVLALPDVDQAADSPAPERYFSRIKGKPDRIDRLFVDVDGSEQGR